MCPGIPMPFWAYTQSAPGGLPEQQNQQKAKREALCMAELCLIRNRKYEKKTRAKLV